MNSAERTELERLLAVLCDGELSDDETGRLNELLRGDRDARRLYLQYVDLHAGLAQHPRLAEWADLTEAAPAAPQNVVTPRNVAASRTVSHRWTPYILTIGATLAASVVLQIAWWRSQPTPPTLDISHIANVAAVVPQYVATLVPGSNCDWNDGTARREGMRLLPGPLSLHSGTAVVRFDGGAELVLEGPVELDIDGVGAATLHEGKVLFRSDESADMFRLNTPLSQMLDYGTEYAVVVAAGNEELHVFDGEVVRTPKSAADLAQTVSVKAGQAWQFLSAIDASRRPVPLDDEHFRRPAAPAAAPNAAGGLTAYDSFDYETFAMPKEPVAPRGTGFASAWLPSPNERRTEFRKTYGLERAGRSQDDEGAVVAPHTGSMYRLLEKPISLDTDGVFYFSFLARTDKLPSEGPCDIRLALHNESDSGPQHRLTTTLSWAKGGAWLSWEGAGNKTSLPIETDRTYLVVGKIVASRRQPDQVFIGVFGPCQKVAKEPADWSVASRPFDCYTVFDAVHIQTSTSTPIIVDELRFGTTWSAVAPPETDRPADSPSANTN